MRELLAKLEQPFIFLTVGNAEQRFDRLVRLGVDLERITGLLLVCQFGRNKYLELNTKVGLDFVSNNLFSRLIENSEFVVSHAGAGTLREIKKQQSKSVVLPRLKKFKEHVNDHQLQIMFQFRNDGLIYVPDDFEQSLVTASNVVQGLDNFSPCLRPAEQKDLKPVIKSLVDGYLREGVRR